MTASIGRPSLRVQAKNNVVAALNSGLLSEPTLMEAMMWEEVSRPVLGSWLPMTAETFLRVREWQGALAPENAWDAENAIAMGELEHQ